MEEQKEKRREMQKSLQRGDVKRLAETLGVHRQTIYDFIAGRNNSKRIGNALSALANSRAQQHQQEISTLIAHAYENNK